MIERLSRKIGFTQTEIKVLFFLIFVFIAGLIYKAYKVHSEATDYKDYDYPTEERLFDQLNSKENSPSDSSEEAKYVDSKREVLDFNSSNFHKKEAKKLPGEKSINLNEAGIEDLVILPGIGEKTAQKIINLRKVKGRFKKLDELLEVKGIGKTRFSNIEKFLYIDQ